MLRRRAAPDGGIASSDSDEQKPLIRRPHPILILVALFTLASPIAYLLGGSTSFTEVKARAKEKLRNAPVQFSERLAQLRGLKRRASEPVAASDLTEQASSEAPGAAAGFWPLIDDALPSEGIRLELVTTKPLSYSFHSTFCDFMEEGTSHMRALANPRKSEGEEEEGGPISCATATFYLVDQETEFSDKIIDYVSVSVSRAWD